MTQKLRSLLPVLIAAAVLFSSCHHVAKHARYVPKDAFAVMGIHTAAMRKEIAWSAVTGSSLLEDLRKAGAGNEAPQAFKDIEHSGIDFGSTLYFYAKPDTRFSGGMKLGAVLPLSDAGELKTYISRHFPAAAIRSAGGRSEAFIGKGMLSWNDEVLMVLSSAVRKVAHNERAITDSVMGDVADGEAYSWTEELPDSAVTAAEMAAAFQPIKDAGINEVERFTDLEKAGHDITLWMSYDALMDMYNTRTGDAAGLGMMGMSMGSTLFKGSAMAAGFDFEKGRIDGLMRYYASDSMQPVAREFARENVDGDMLRRLPAPGLNMAAGYHLSPAAIKLMLEKMNLSGMANLALMSQGLTLDDVLGGFSGDMVVAVNNFRVTQQVQQVDSATQAEYGIEPYAIRRPAMDFVFAMKIGDRARLMKLLSLAGGANVLRQTAPDTYQLPGGQGGSLVVGDKYIAASSNAASAQNFLKEHAGAMPDAVHSEISGHPVGMWADVHGFLNAGGVSGSASDSAAMTVLRNTFTVFSAHGGEFKHGANEYRMSLGFMNKEESSLLQLLRLAQQLAALNKERAQVAIR